LKDRFSLLLLFLSIWGFLLIFQRIIPVESKLYIIFGFVILYTIGLNIVYKHQRRKIKKKPPVLDTSYQPFVSILIPAHNEEFVIANTIENVLQVDYEKCEIIVIDDRSTDNTAEKLKNISRKYPDKVKYIIRDKDAFPGKSAVLNEAIEQSKGEVICVFDADARIKPEFLKALMPYLAPKDVGAVQARKVIINKDYNLLTRCQNNEYTLDSHFQSSRDSIKGAVELRGNGQLIKKEALQSVGGWNIYTITDDLDISTKLHLNGWDVRYCPVTEVYEEGITKILPLLRQRRRWVEGSIRRYIDYFVNVLTSRKISLRASIDMWAYIFEFVLPVWLFLDWTIQSLRLIRGREHDISDPIVVGVLVCMFFILGLLYSLKKYDRLSIWQTIKQSIETGLYMFLIWVPVVTFILFKIIFFKRTMDWGKTAHGTPVAATEQDVVPTV
jgi:1,2-diacylglycerol 3-beta-glucosyltransferase